MLDIDWLHKPFMYNPQLKYNQKLNCIDSKAYFVCMKYYKKHVTGTGMITFCFIMTPFLEILLILSVDYSKG